MSASQLAEHIKSAIRPIVTDAEAALLIEKGYGNKLLLRSAKRAS